MKIIFALLASLLIMPLHAAEEVVFSTAEQQQRYEQLIDELRCLVCQNQTIADSNAGLAVDLRRQVAEQVRAGKTNVEIKDYLTERYGDFVLYKPRVKPETMLLWFGPVLIFLIALGVLVGIVRNRRRQLDHEEGVS